MVQKDFYKVLGVGEKASADEIKKAYKQLAVQLHPDKYPSSTEAERKAKAAAESRFKEISEAYATLGDEGKRYNYDLGRNSPVQAGNDDLFNGLLNDLLDLQFAFTIATIGKKQAANFLHTSMLGGDQLIVEKLLKAGIVPAEKTLKYVVEQGWPTWTKRFINAGAKPTSGMLHHATERRDVDVANALIKGGAVPAKKTLRFVKKRGWTGWEKGLESARAKNGGKATFAQHFGFG